MSFLPESAVEQALLEQLRTLNYSIEREEDIGPDGLRPERASHSEVILKKRLEDAVAYSGNFDPLFWFNFDPKLGSLDFLKNDY